jgi:hypothetical protein
MVRAVSAPAPSTSTTRTGDPGGSGAMAAPSGRPKRGAGPGGASLTSAAAVVDAMKRRRRSAIAP